MCHQVLLDAITRVVRVGRLKGAARMSTAESRADFQQRPTGIRFSGCSDEL